jgi:hypothetical protein
MGGGSSSSVTNVIDTSVAVKTLTNAIMSCRGNSNITQMLNISGDNNTISGVRQLNAFKLSSTCNQEIKDNKQIQQDIANQLTAAAEAKGSGILSALGGSKSDVNTKIFSDISTMLESNTVNNIVNNVNQLQGINISGNNNIVKDFTQQMTSELVFSSVQTAINNLDAVQRLNTASNSQSTAVTTNPISDVIDSVFNGLSGLLKYWVILVIVVVLILAILFRNQIKDIFCIIFPICSDDEKKHKNKKNKSTNNQHISTKKHNKQ